MGFVVERARGIREDVGLEFCLILRKMFFFFIGEDLVWVVSVYEGYGGGVVFVGGD